MTAVATRNCAVMTAAASAAAAVAVLASAASSSAFAIGAPKVMPPSRGALGHRSSRPPSRTWLSLASQSSPGANGDGKGDDDEPDLFEYFDPLLSPHAYPNGIGPESMPRTASSSARTSPPPPPPLSSTIGSIDDDDFDYDCNEKGEEDEDISEKGELLEEFDPLRSPHEYPRGIDAVVKKSGSESSTAETVGASATAGEDDDDEWTPFHLRTASKDVVKEENARPKRRRKVYNRPNGMDDERLDANPVERVAESGGGPSRSDRPGEEGPKPDLFDVFDPRISPHAYADGIPETVTYADESSITYAAFDAPAASLGAASTPRGEEEIVGVLLIDHGSRRGPSNARLQRLARAYDARTSSRFVVRAAHMEIARPSIEDGLRSLRDAGARWIVCHPYFLSVGRHATEDVPRLIDEAAGRLGLMGGEREVRVATTDPVGSRTDAMLGAIDSLVTEALEGMEEEFGVFGGGRESGGKDELGGLFGDIKRMMDEQL